MRAGVEVLDWHVFLVVSVHAVEIAVRLTAGRPHRPELLRVAAEDAIVESLGGYITLLEHLFVTLLLL